MTTYTRPVLLLLCGLLLLTLAIAVLNTLVPLWLAHENLPTWQVGMVSSSFFTGNLLGTLMTGSLIKRFGFNRSYYLASLIFAAGCAGLGLMVGFWSWMAWRFIAGVGCAMIWVVVESALMCSGTSRNRGRLLAAYMMVYYVGTVLGQLMVSKLPTDLMSVLPWVTGMVLAAILPLCGYRALGPTPLVAGLRCLVRSKLGSPIFFKQERPGLHEKIFTMYKFRTMTQGADKQQDALRAQNERDGAAFKMKNDPRVTPLGHWLRKTSIDELPQLFNVLKGEMSMVGPRPLPLADFETYVRLRSS